MPPSQHAPQVLAAYRELLRLVRRLPGGQQQQAAWQEARQAMRQHQGEADAARRVDLFKQLAARVSFLRVVTPKAPSEASSIGAGSYVLREGKLVQAQAETAGKRCATGRPVLGLLLSPEVPCQSKHQYAPGVCSPAAGWPTARSPWGRRGSGTRACCSASTLGGRPPATTPPSSETGALRGLARVAGGC